MSKEREKVNSRVIPNPNNNNNNNKNNNNKNNNNKNNKNNSKNMNENEIKLLYNSVSLLMESFQNHKEEIKKYQFQIQKLQDQLIKKDIIIEELNKKNNELLEKKWKNDFYKELLISFKEEFIASSKEKKRLNSIIDEITLKATNSLNSQPSLIATPASFNNSKKLQSKTFEIKNSQPQPKQLNTGKPINNQQPQRQSQRQQHQPQQLQQKNQQYLDRQLDIEKDIEEVENNWQDEFEDYEEGLLNQIELDSM
ncbi:hypothetical protein ACTFIV_009177 [Dictyostelium citrinum]